MKGKFCVAKNQTRLIGAVSDVREGLLCSSGNPHQRCILILITRRRLVGKTKEVRILNQRKEWQGGREGKMHV